MMYQVRTEIQHAHQDLCFTSRSSHSAQTTYTTNFDAKRAQEEIYGTADEQTPSPSPLVPSPSPLPSPSFPPAPLPGMNASNASSTGRTIVPVEDCPVGMSVFDHPEVVASRQAYDNVVAREL